MSRWLGASKRWLKLLTCWEMGMYSSATRNWPATPMGTPSTSIQRNRRPMSRTMSWVPRTHEEAQAAPKNPDHNPISVETTYQVGGSLSLAMALSDVESPAMAAAATARISATIWPTRNPRAKKSSQVHAADEVGAAPASS